MTPLAVIKLVNTGIMAWEAIGPKVQAAMENGTDVDMADVEAAAAAAGNSLDALDAAIARAQTEGR